MFRLVATVGDPASIGPEVALAAIEKFLSQSDDVEIHLFASERVFHLAHSKIWSALSRNPSLVLHDLNKGEEFEIGRGTQASGARALVDLDSAISFVLKDGSQALVTGPVDKSLCAKTDPKFRGQTEYLMEKSGSAGVTMMLASADLRVSLVTTHVAIREVSNHLSKEKILATAIRTHEHVKQYKQVPAIGICALNPHASDNGLFGDEEERVIRPAVAELRSKGIAAEGPLPADTAFYFRKRFDALVCMYHDQALIPLKMEHFFDAINISLGLPFLRVSVDHGTAFDMVGSGKASALSYENALRYAVDWLRKTSSARAPNSNSGRAGKQS